MKVRILKNDIVLTVKSFNEKTKIITVSICGTICKFRQNEYEVVEDDN